jgi:hypothetical protein
MRLGVGRLLIAIAAVVVRLNGDHSTANLLGLAFLGAATFDLYWTPELRTAVRTTRS